MALVDVLRNNFTAGELSPLMEGRTDFQRYQNGARKLENWIVIPQGGVTRRPGLRYVATVKDPSRLTILLPFEASVSDSYVIEAGHLYFRFYKNAARIESGGSPVEVATPYQESDLRRIRTAQSNDVMILAHPNYAPRRLSRLSDTSWTLKTINFLPPPTFEAGTQPAASITPGATTGTITITASAAVFLETDVDRQIIAGDARAVITAVSSATTVTALVLDAFADTSPVAAGSWTLDGSPVAECKPSKEGPSGASVTLELRAVQENEAELVTNGDFASGLTGWTNHSGPQVVSGTATNASPSNTVLQDSAATFQSSGVQVSHIVTNTTDSATANITSVDSETQVTTDGLTGGANFDSGDAYRINQTGSAAAVSGKAQLNGGTAGIGWIEQAVSTVSGRSYRVVFDVLDNPLSLQVGSTSKASDILAEAQYDIQNGHEVIFTATGATTYIQFRNNQNVNASVDNVSVKLFSAEGWRSGDVGKYVKLNAGLVKVTGFSDPTQVTGEIVVALASDSAAASGAWTLEAEAWSDTLGWPEAVAFYEGRLYLAGTIRFPQTLWGSAIDDFFNFFFGSRDDDGVKIPIVDSAGNITLNIIRWLMPAEQFLAGTTHAEYRIAGRGDDPITPTLTPRVRVQSTFGADTVQPLKVGQAVLFAQRMGSKLREMLFDDRSLSFISRDLTILSGHLLEDNRIVQMAYQQEPLSIVWAVRSDGTLLGLTYDQVEQVVGWHRHTTSGSFESVAVVPHPTANRHQVWCVVKRTIGGQTVRYVEYFDSLQVEPATGQKGVYVDAALGQTFTTPTQAITGLSHLEGETVDIVGDGAVFPPQAVSGGQITLDVAVSTVQVGLGYVSDGETLRPEIPVRGSSQLLQKRWVELLARLYNTVGLTLQGQQMPFLKHGDVKDQGMPVFTGDKPIVSSGWDRDARITFKQEQPLPATVLAVVGTMDIGADGRV